MKSIPLIILAILISLSSCDSNKNKVTKPEKKVIDFKIPVVSDTSKSIIIARNTIWLQDGNFCPYYLGPWKDSINVPYKQNLKKFFVYDGARMRYHEPDSVEILLVVDTTKIISDKKMNWGRKGIEYSIEAYKAYPVFIVNLTNDTLNIGYGDHLPIIMEAMDNNGRWRPIEEPYIYFCGTGLNDIILPPKEIIVTAAPIDSGEIKTKIRLRFNKILSNEFSGTINPGQFESEEKRYYKRNSL